MSGEDTAVDQDGGFALIDIDAVREAIEGILVKSPEGGEDSGRRVEHQVAARIVSVLIAEDALPLRRQLWDVTVDDPGMLAKHEFRGVEAGSSTAAAVGATREAYRREGFNPGMPQMRREGKRGDEQTVDVAHETYMYAIVHRAGEHPDIDYGQPARVVRLANERDDQVPDA